MKRFLRYLLLIVCVMVFGAWTRSYWYLEVLGYQFPPSFCVISDSGKFAFDFEELAKTFQTNPGFFRRHAIASNQLSSVYPGSPRFEFMGVTYFANQIDMESRYALKYRIIIIPYWLLFTPLFLLTLALWYHPIKNWWQGTDRQGFEVEVNPNVEDSPDES